MSEIADEISLALSNNGMPILAIEEIGISTLFITLLPEYAENTMRLLRSSFVGDSVEIDLYPFENDENKSRIEIYA